MMVVMSSSPVSMYMYSAYIGVDCGTMSILRIILSCIWLIFISSFFVVFIVSPPYVRIGCMQVSRSFHAVSSSSWLPSTVRIVWYAASVFLFNCIIHVWSSVNPLWFSISPRYV